MKHPIAKFLILIFLLFSIKTYAYDFEADGFFYNVINHEGKEVEVTYKTTNHNSYSGIVNIPSTSSYNGETYSVTSIGKEAFSVCTSLISVTIPNSVTNIGERAFFYCTNIRSLTIGSSVTSIGKLAFSGCTGLIAVTIPNSVTNIGDDAFLNCKNIRSLTIGSSVTSIGKEAFSGCTGLIAVTIPNSVTNIGEQAFFNCTNIRSLTIGSSVTSIGNYAFSTAASAGHTFTIPKVVWLGNTPPAGSSGIKADLNYVSNNEFSLSNQKVYPFLSSRFEVNNVVYVPVSPSERTCDVIDCNYAPTSTEITIDSIVKNKNIELKVLKVNNYSFYKNESISKLIISNSGNIGNYAFYNCNALTSVVASNNGYIGG